MRYPLAAILLSVPVLAQSNAVPGTDVMAYDIANCQVYGRRGAAYPNGEAVMNIGHSMCNAGSTFIPWAGTSGGLMLSTFPKIATLIAREANGRMTQISGLSFAKYSRTAFNFTSGPCTPCQTGPTQTWRVGCSDTYSSGFSSLSSLGPTTEIDPWLGTWNPVGSYFDRGDPEVAAPANSDGVQSAITGDNLKNRMVVPESELVGGGAYWSQAQISVIGEPGTNRGNNAACKPVTFTWNGTAWTGATTGTASVGPVLTHWTGAQTSVARNGNDDGHFMAGWKVTGPVNGFYHYELAIHNLDNNSGGGALRIPVCSTAQVVNAGFRDIDGNALNQWTFSRTTGEIAWLAAANNAIEWNSLYNFWFDCDAAPVPGTLSIDRARPGPGALTVAIAAEVPGAVGNEHLGAGCGAPSPAPALVASGLPTVPAPTFSLALQGQPFSITVLVASLGGANLGLGSGCTAYIDDQQIALFEYAVTDITGTALWSLPIPATVQTADVWVQGAQYVNGGPALGGFTLTNGILLHVGGNACP